MRGEYLCILPSLLPMKCQLEDTAQPLSFWENLGVKTPAQLRQRGFGDLQCIVLSELAGALSWQRRREIIMCNKMPSPGTNKEEV